MSLLAALPPPREILSSGGERRAPSVVAARQGRRALICADERFARTPEFREIVAALEAASIAVFVYDRALPDAPLHSSSKDFRS